MNRLVYFMLATLMLSSLSFAEPKVYTNEDLDKYNSNPVVSEKPQPSSEQLQQEPFKEERSNFFSEKLKKEKESNESAEKYQIGSRDCEVIKFNASVSGSVYTQPYDGYGSITMRQCVRATIRNSYGMTRWVKDFSIVALFANKTTEANRMMPIQGNDTTQIMSGETYTGVACFGETALILKLGCNVSK